MVGLGNPGERYRRTRHNVGFMVVDALAARAGARAGSEHEEAWVAEAELASEPVLLVKPLTFMNRSGVAVERLAGRVGASPQETVVVVDDWALELGRLRVRQRGSHGGHNGLRDTITHCGADFWRLRLGIGHPGDRDQVIDYVLQRASPADEEAIVAGIGASLEALSVFLSDGAEKAMKMLHTQESDQ